MRCLYRIAQYHSISSQLANGCGAFQYRGNQSAFMFHPFMLLLISMVPIWAVCITWHEPFTNCGGKTVDVIPALRSFGLKAAGVMIINEG